MQDLLCDPDDLIVDSRHSWMNRADPRQRAWLEVSPAALQSNARNLIGRLVKGCSLMAVVKADGYGHGAVTVAKASIDGGATSLGVATLQEGIELRQAGLQTPILVLGNITDAEDLRACLHWHLMPTINDLTQLLLCESLAKDTGRKFDLQLKFDTGMTRLGYDVNKIPRLIETFNDLTEINLTGIYSHLAMANVDNGNGKANSVTEIQQKKFDFVLREFASRDKGICRHLANSAGTLRNDSLHYDMVRVGLALYGHNPLQSSPQHLDLKPALAVKAKVTMVKDVPSGVGVSYGHQFYTKRKSRLAVVGIGYADGISRALSGKISALFKGRFVPQVGSITMDQLVLDATQCPELRVGSVVTMLGEDGGKCITPQSWSDLTGSIPWEVLCGFKHRLPRLVV